ncbi:alpha/beta hydrolase [Fodinicola feengrottensis]|uniref:alpha/beta hydrolase n=1 Tax=Fodinicola feengrottensis TaxID=435914 RepID=UPI0024415131|nr:alpha/beta hydrolase [Fodinicola feengrottensis]
MPWEQPKRTSSGSPWGGAIAQQLALDHADRLTSVTFMSTTAGPGDADLPPMSPELKASFAEAAAPPDWTDRSAVIESVVRDQQLVAGQSLPFDEPAARALAVQVFDRTKNMAAGQNHWMLEGGASQRHRLAEISLPTLVMHGTEDPLFPYGHGVALAREIRAARLVPLEGAGHELPRPC